MGELEHVYGKPVNILITNICNLKCGGCSQLIGEFKPRDYFMISEDQFRMNVKVVGKYIYKAGYIGIFGGEPSVHPKFKEILEICEKEFPQYNFLLYTNGNFVGNLPKNITLRTDLKGQNISKFFAPTMVAGKDVYKVEDNSFYFETLAKQNCYMWKHCNSIIYDNKFYFCEAAGAYDRLDSLKLNFGFPVIAGKNPLDGKTDQDIKTQANEACYRCGWCLNNEDKKRYNQQSNKPTIVSEINLSSLKKKIKF